jgi:hypothetical protein
MGVTPTPNKDISMPDFSNPVLDPEELNFIIDQNILEEEKPKFCRQLIT